MSNLEFTPTEILNTIALISLVVSEEVGVDYFSDEERQFFSELYKKLMIQLDRDTENFTIEVDHG
ncbi:hypothetical protein [Neptunomonas sp.]|uniref:hypothetical protein n=1 Tax=Neptunomonas sp. TaxID=1971898 RepID=UPI0035631C9D